MPKRYVGKTLIEADFTNEYKVLVLTTLKPTEVEKRGLKSISNESTGIAKSTTLLSENDILVLFGNPKDINRMIEER